MQSLTERETIDRIEVLPITGHVQVRVRQAVIRVTTSEDEIPVITEEEVSWKFLRYVLEKGSDLSGQPDSVRALAEAAWGIIVPEETLA